MINSAVAIATQTPTIVKRQFGKEGTLRFAVANARLAKENAVLASNAETAIAFMAGEVGEEYSLMTRTAAIYHVRRGHRFVAFDDDPRDNTLLELDFMLDDAYHRLVPERTRIVQRQLERAYDAKRVVRVDGKEACQTRIWHGYTCTSFHNNRFSRSTGPTPPNGSAFSRDRRYIAFFGDEDITRRFSRFAFRTGARVVPLYVEGRWKPEVREGAMVQICACEIYSVEGNTYLQAEVTNFSDQSAGLGVRLS